MAVIPADTRKPSMTARPLGLNNIGIIVRPAYTPVLTYNGRPSKNIPMGLANVRNDTTDEPSIANMTAAATLLVHCGLFDRRRKIGI